ncbi:MAG: hypothetical protein IM613_12365 [Cytophagales bacterium]|nr:hypothetical protein [Cytophagales bacterium]
MTRSRGRWAFDIEANGLLDHTTVDYTQSPYRLKPHFLIHCICFEDIDTGRTVKFIRTKFPTHEEFRLYVLDFIEEYVQIFVAQNGLDYDWLVLKAYFGVDYFVAGDPSEQDVFNGKPIVFRDTLVMSKLYNSERYGGHSLESWGEELGYPKIDWRQRAIDLGLITKNDLKGAEFRVYHPEMLDYCQRDVTITAKLFLHLEKEISGWNWSSSLLLEQRERDIVTKQSHRGFQFAIELAQESLVDLDSKMQALRNLVEPVIPPKPLTQAKLKLWTPPARQLVYEKPPQVPKVQIKKDGSPSQAMLRYAEAVGGVIEDYGVPDGYTTNDDVLWLRVGDSLYSFSSTAPLEEDTVPFFSTPTLSTNIETWVQKHGGFLHYTDDKWYANIEGEDYQLPIPCEPLRQQEPASIQDVTHLKGWLCIMGWIPTQWKEKDLTVDTKKKKLTPEKYQETAQRYIDQTLVSPFKKFRFEKLDVHSNTQFINKILNHRLDRPLKVYTNPSLTVGMSKEIDPAIAAIEDKFPYAKQVSEYLTYNHRRNSIASNGFVFDDEDDEDNEPDAGFLSASRIYEDGRIPTPADTNGCNTSRMKHRVVCNISRNSSLYGKQMRSLFGVADGCLQLGFDFGALENRMQSHYVYKYDTEGKPYCKSLLGDKDLGEDCHTLTAKYISQVLGYDFSRDAAKQTSYCCAYGGSPAKVAQTIGSDLDTGKVVHKSYWESAEPLASLKVKLEEYWEKIGQKKFILGLDGRKIQTRSKSSLINALFQSGGTICVKRANVIFDSLLRSHGLICDFWTEDYKNKTYAQQMIVVHDEIQLEITKDLVQYQIFPVTEWEYDKKGKPFSSTVLAVIRDFRSTHPNWSSVHQTTEGYVLSYSIVGDLALQAVAQAGEYYKLNVPLTAEYAIGSNWSQTH